MSERQKQEATASQSPVAKPYDRETAARRARVALRQAVWEVDQFISVDDIRAYVESVIREIESDRP